jgi:hypothetical protein
MTKQNRWQRTCSTVGVAAVVDSIGIIGRFVRSERRIYVAAVAATGDCVIIGDNNIF